MHILLSSGVLLRQISQQKSLFKQGDHTYPPISQREKSFFSWTTSKIFKVSFAVTFWHKWFKEFAHLSAEKSHVKKWATLSDEGRKQCSNEGDNEAGGRRCNWGDGRGVKYHFLKLKTSSLTSDQWSNMWMWQVSFCKTLYVFFEINNQT